MVAVQGVRAAHTRLDVRVGAVVWYWKGEQTVKSAHTRSLPPKGGDTSYCVSVHTL